MSYEDSAFAVLPVELLDCIFEYVVRWEIVRGEREVGDALASLYSAYGARAWENAVTRAFGNPSLPNIPSSDIFVGGMLENEVAVSAVNGGVCTLVRMKGQLHIVCEDSTISLRGSSFGQGMSTFKLNESKTAAVVVHDGGVWLYTKRDGWVGTAVVPMGILRGVATIEVGDTTAAVVVPQQCVVLRWSDKIRITGITMPPAISTWNGFRDSLIVEESGNECKVLVASPRAITLVEHGKESLEIPEQSLIEFAPGKFWPKRSPMNMFDSLNALHRFKDCILLVCNECIINLKLDYTFRTIYKCPHGSKIACACVAGDFVVITETMIGPQLSKLVVIRANGSIVIRYPMWWPRGEPTAMTCVKNGIMLTHGTRLSAMFQQGHEICLWRLWNEGATIASTAMSSDTLLQSFEMRDSYYYKIQRLLAGVDNFKRFRGTEARMWRALQECEPLKRRKIAAEVLRETECESDDIATLADTGTSKEGMLLMSVMFARAMRGAPVYA